MSDHNTLQLKLVGQAEDSGLVYFSDFREFCDAVALCLRRTEAIVSSRKGRIRYRIVGLEVASASVTLEAVKPKQGRDNRKQVIGLFQRTVTAIQRGRKVDPRMSSSDLGLFKKLVAPLSKTASELWVGEQLLTGDYLANIDKLLNNLMPSHGAVRGRLEKLNVHNKLEFVLFPPIAGHAITCSFPESLVDDIRQAIKRSVTVRGTLFFQSDKAYPDRVKVDTIEIHPYDDNLPRLVDLRGMAPGCTGGLTAVEFTQALRNE